MNFVKYQMVFCYKASLTKYKIIKLISKHIALTDF